MITYNGGIIFPVDYPQYGQQHLGISPGGAIDMLAFRYAHIMIARAVDYCAYEIIAAPRIITFTHDVIFVITGGEYSDCILVDASGNHTKLAHAEVYRARNGAKLMLSGLKKGFRSYLFVTTLTEENLYLCGRRRGKFEQELSSYSALINVTRGPEHDYIENEQDFLRNYWHIAPNSDNMGVRLLGKSCPLKKYDILSSAVCPGVIQFSKNEPIILMRQCQTIGGYPRGFVLSSVSLSHLAQLAPNQKIRFKLVSNEFAVNEVQRVEKMLRDFEVYLNENDNLLTSAD